MPWNRVPREKRPAVEGAGLADLWVVAQRVGAHIAGILSTLSSIHLELAKLRAEVERLKAGPQ